MLQSNPNISSEGWTHPLCAEWAQFWNAGNVLSRSTNKRFITPATTNTTYFSASFSPMAELHSQKHLLCSPFDLIPYCRKNQESHCFKPACNTSRLKSSSQLWDVQQASEDSTMQPVTAQNHWSIPQNFTLGLPSNIFSRTQTDFYALTRWLFFKEYLRLVHFEIVIKLPAAHICQWFSTCSNTQWC